MVKVQPFRALRYEAARVDLAKVTTPPHDVITAEQKARSRIEPLGMAHIILPEEGGESRFEVAARHIADWTAQGFLARDEEPAFYRYQVTHGPADERRTMQAFFARVGIDATMRQVRPHERTLARKKGDRLRLRQAAHCDVEPIWLLYRDEPGHVDIILEDASEHELCRFTDPEGAEHRLWAVRDPLAVGDIARWFEGETLVIADGHHRYQSALEHFAASGRPEDASILACLSRDGDPGIRVEATHRVLNWGRSFNEAMAACRAAWRVSPLPAPRLDDGSWSRASRELLQSLEGAGTAVLVGKLEGKLEAYLLTLSEPRAHGLGVTLVQERLLSACWGLEESGSTISYERDAASCIRAVAEGHADLAVLLPPERVQSVLDAAKEGRLMPAKATYFTPKPASGLVLAPLDEA